jgi:uncharacterized protein (DUF433 family)
MQLEDYFDFLSPDDIRIKGHRIGIDNVLALYLDGYTAEDIAHYYPSLSLEKIHATLTYYHHKRADVDAYMARLAAWRAERLREAELQEPTPAMRRIRELKARRQAELLGRT